MESKIRIPRKLKKQVKKVFCINPKNRTWVLVKKSFRYNRGDFSVTIRNKNKRS